eukprot:4071032-Pyramimonas_sp.AAC.2
MGRAGKGQLRAPTLDGQENTNGPACESPGLQVQSAGHVGWGGGGRQAGPPAGVFNNEAVWGTAGGLAPPEGGASRLRARCLDEPRMNPGMNRDAHTRLRQSE